MTESHWQLCPKCHGGKIVIESVGTSVNTATCQICNGYGIINQLTGLPPKENKLEEES